MKKTPPVGGRHSNRLVHVDAAAELLTRLLDPRNMALDDMSLGVPKCQPPKPLTEPVLLILLSLAEKPRHGYGLMKDIENLSHGRVRLSTGTLYGALRRLLEDLWIERFEQADTSREKQAYKLTPAGRTQLHAELERMRQLTRAARTRLRMREA